MGLGEINGHFAGDERGSLRRGKDLFEVLSFNRGIDAWEYFI
jgi:hypothetical protein